jgi:hypothetical protein
MRQINPPTDSLMEGRAGAVPGFVLAARPRPILTLRGVWSRNSSITIGRTATAAMDYHISVIDSRHSSALPNNPMTILTKLTTSQLHRIIAIQEQI